MEALHKASDGKCHICPPTWELDLLLTVPVSLCFAVSHHICEQAPEQAEFGGDGTGDPGKLCSGLRDPLSGVIFSRLSDPRRAV